MSILSDLERSLRAKIDDQQAGVPTFFDNAVLHWLGLLKQPKTTGVAQVDRAETLALHAVLLRWSQIRTRERFATYAERAVETESWTPLPWEISAQQLDATQGVDECLQWRGLPLFKSVFDFAIYPMLIAEVQPQVIMELGSGSGGSALWFADLLRLNKLAGKVISVDLHVPTVDDPKVTFLQGDCRNIDAIFPPESLARMPHPWLIVEDAHVNTLQALRHFSAASRPGDYVVVEDSRMKGNDLKAFSDDAGANWRVDSRYTDFFGRNATCSADSIFKRI